MESIQFENDKTDLEAIKMSYIQARDPNPDPIGVSIGKERSKVEERERQLQEQIEVEHWKVEEERRQTEESLLLRQKVEVELERYKVMTAHRGGY